ncbi:MAG: 3'(2'),5'-bisphosphate nucleotidase CysQ [Thiolinea sp.]
MNLEKLTEAACAIACEAGEKIMAIYNSADFSVEHKKDDSPLTAADLASHRCIVAALEEMTPEYPVLSEESAAIPFAERSQWTTYWLVDPLDGTREFIKQNGEFSVLIALIHNHEPVLGVVHAPAIETTWYASLGNGAFKQTGEYVVPLQVREAGETLAVVGSRSHAGDSLKAFLAKIGEHELVSMGSILKACLVADGRADIYPRLGLTSEWDTAAAQIIVEEAGGQVTQTDMSPMRYNTKESLLNPHFLVFGDASRNWGQYFTAKA